MIDINKQRLKSQIENSAKQKYKDKCRDSLCKAFEKKITTTMIGALSAIEEEFGEMWNHGSTPQTKEQMELRDQYNSLRKRILDLGNSQVKKMKDELFNYDVENRQFHFGLLLEEQKRDK
jgi:hypothetical protein